MPMITSGQERMENSKRKKMYDYHKMNLHEERL